MKTIRLAVLFSAAMSSSALAQQWEIGGVGGGSFLNNVAVSGAPASGNAGFATGAVVGVFVNQRVFRRVSGEVRYEYFQSDLKLSSGGSSAEFSGRAHAFHYDLLLHTTNEHRPVQFFIAVGGGAKIFQGTGTETAYQPLNQYGYFTKTIAVKPMASLGAGISVSLSHHVNLRAEVRDFISAFPTAVLTPPPGVKYGSVLNDIVPMAGIGFLF